MFLVLLLSTQPQVPSEEWAERAKVLQKLRKINLISPEFCGKVSASPEKQNVRKRIIPRKMLKRRIPRIIPKHSRDNQSGRIKLKSDFCRNRNPAFCNYKSELWKFFSNPQPRLARCRDRVRGWQGRTLDMNVGVCECVTKKERIIGLNCPRISCLISGIFINLLQSLQLL